MKTDEELRARAQQLWKGSDYLQTKWVEAVKTVRNGPGWRFDRYNQPPMIIPTGANG